MNPAGRVVVVGLGPGDLSAGPGGEILLDEERTVLVRTLRHPGAVRLAELRPVESGDRFYEAEGDLEDVYQRLAEWVLERAETEPVVYAVPGSPLVGERSVSILRGLCRERRIEVEILPALSFLDLAIERLGLDPLENGLQILDGRRLPDPLSLHLPALIAQIDSRGLAASIKDRLGRVLPGEAEVVILADLGAPDEVVERIPLAELDRRPAGPRLSLFLDPEQVGWWGLVRTVRRLRVECPWDARQTHHSLTRHLIEEAYETADAIAGLSPEAPGGPVNHEAYLELEGELGDLLLQVVFHANLARGAGVFDVEEVAEMIRRKLVRRHPHVFGDTEVSGPSEVIRNWERLKQEEKGRQSLMDDVSEGLPALARAAKIQRRAASVGFDWPEADPVLEKVAEELGELQEAVSGRGSVDDELGDLLFSLVNLSRHLHVDPEMALRGATERFAARFRAMEAAGDLSGLSLQELDARWDQVKKQSELDEP